MAVTFDFAPQSSTGNRTVNALYADNSHKAYVVTVRSTSNGDNTAVDLQGNDGANGSIFDTILRELNPAMAFGKNATDGVIYLIMDGHHNDATSIAARIGALDGCGTDTAATLGTGIVVS